MTVNASDSELLKKAQSGDRDALSRLLILHEQACFELALYLSGNEADAADVCQDAFFRVVRDIASVRQDHSFRFWLLRIVSHAFRDRLISEKARRNRERSFVMESSNSKADPAANAETLELQKYLNTALLKLHEKHRAPIALHYKQGLSYSETAAVLDMPEGTVATNIRNGLEELRRLLRTAGCACAVPASLTAALPQTSKVVVPASLTAYAHAIATTAVSSGIKAGGAVLALKIAACVTLVSLLSVSGYSGWKYLTPQSASVGLVSTFGETGEDVPPPPVTPPDKPKPVYEDELLIPPTQDVETMKRAYQAFVKVDYTNQSFKDILADLSKQSGIEIELDPAYPNAGRGGGCNWDCDLVLRTGYAERIRAKKFLNQEQIDRIIPVKVHFEENSRLNCTGLIPLSMILSTVVDAFSYRQGKIFVSSKEALYNDWVITRKFHLKHAWGMKYENNYNGKDFSFRLNLLDTVAQKLLGHTDSILHSNREYYDATSYDGPDPSGAYDRLKKLKVGPDMSFDENTRILTVTAHASAIDCFTTCDLEQLDQPSPEEQQKLAIEFERTKLKETAPAAWEKSSDEEKKTIHTLIKQLASDVYDERETAQQKLMNLGLPVAAPFLEKDFALHDLLPSQRYRKHIKDNSPMKICESVSYTTD